MFKQEAMARGARAFLEKPFGRAELLPTLTAVLAGAQLDAASLAAHADQVVKHHERESEARDALLARLDLDDPDLKARVRALVRWCAGYFDVTVAVVNIQRGNKIHALACTGDEIAEGAEIDRELSYCTEVIEAASPLVVSDASASPLFVQHPAASAGYRFYAGVPIRAGDVVVGTLCLLDKQRHGFFGEDLTLLENLADGVSRRLQVLAGRDITAPPVFVVPGVFTRQMLNAIVVASVRRVSRSRGGIELAHIELGTDDPNVYLTCTGAIFNALGRAWIGVAEYSRGVLAVIIGAGTAEAARVRMDQALDAAQSATESIRGIGVISFQADIARLIETTNLEGMADGARVAAVSSGGIHRIDLHAERPATGAPQPAAG